MNFKTSVKAYYLLECNISRSSSRLAYFYERDLVNALFKCIRCQQWLWLIQPIHEVEREQVCLMVLQLQIIEQMTQLKKKCCVGLSFFFLHCQSACDS